MGKINALQDSYIYFEILTAFFVSGPLSPSDSAHQSRMSFVGDYDVFTCSSPPNGQIPFHFYAIVNLKHI